MSLVMGLLLPSDGSHHRGLSQLGRSLWTSLSGGSQEEGAAVLLNKEPPGPTMLAPPLPPWAPRPCKPEGTLQRAGACGSFENPRAMVGNGFYVWIFTPMKPHMKPTQTKAQQLRLR